MHPATLLQILDRFNRKERYFLVATALGNHRFQMSAPFREELGKLLGLGSIPIDAYCWLDFHLDWVYAATQLLEAPSSPDHYESPRFISQDKDVEPYNINRNQEDTDLLIGYDDDEGLTRLIFVEAKGVKQFSNKQMKSKGGRLEVIFGPNGKGVRGIQPHFVIASPRPPVFLKPEGLPKWMCPDGEFLWLRLRIPPHRIQIERYDAKKKVRSKVGEQWRVVPIRQGTQWDIDEDEEEG